MNRILSGLAASVAVAALTGGTAMAQPGMPTTWSGFYVGANGGVIDAMTTHTNLADHDFEPFVPGKQPGLDSVGAIGGGQIGYNFQFSSRVVVGLEGDIDGIIGAHASGNTGASGPEFGVQSSRWSALGTARGRIGYAFDSVPMMIYGTGGAALGDVKNYAANVFSGGGGFGEQWPKSGWRAGWTAGGGAEWMCGRNWSVKAEVLYVDLGGYSTNGQGNDPRCRQGFSNTAVIGRAGVNLHF